jgi:hypothetical protein
MRRLSRKVVHSNNIDSVQNISDGTEDTLPGSYHSTLTRQPYDNTRELSLEGSSDYDTAGILLVTGQNLSPAILLLSCLNP